MEKYMFVVFFATALALVAPSSGCDMRAGRRCLKIWDNAYIKLEKQSNQIFCSSYNDELKKVDDCLQGLNCDSSEFTDYSKIVGTIEILEATICNPTQACSRLKVFDCFKDFFNAVQVQIPSDLSGTAKALDAMHVADRDNNRDDICRDVKSIDIKSQYLCRHYAYGNFIESCVVDLERSNPNLADALGGHHKVGYTIRRLTEQQLTGAKLAEFARDYCQSGCENYSAKYNAINECLAGVAYTFRNDPDKTQKCSKFEQAVPCMTEAAKGCPILENERASQESLRYKFVCIYNVYLT